MTTIQELQFRLINRPPYSLDLAPSDFFLFPKLKAGLRVQRLPSYEEVIESVDVYFAEHDVNYFLEKLKHVEHRWTTRVVR